MYRLKAGLRQIDIAQALKMDCADRISRWEHGVAMPQINNLFRLAILYKVSPQDLYPELWQDISVKIASRCNTTQTSPDNPNTDTLNSTPSMPAA